MRIAISTDCWFPQNNGITQTIAATIGVLKDLHHEVMLVKPDDFASLKLPYGDSLVMPWYPKISRLLSNFSPDTVHISTQGVLGLLTRMWCRLNKVHYSTAFHTLFPEYANLRYGIPKSVCYKYARFFHAGDAPVLVPSRVLADALRAQGIRSTKIWGRGVDLARYHPRPKTWIKYRRPILLYVGRVAEEKNVRAFLDLGVDGTKIVVGSGPGLDRLATVHPDTLFLGELCGESLAECYGEADVFVFPSRLETFGLVILEALASGIPVAAIPSPQLADIFGVDGAVVFDEDLLAAVARARQVPAERCREHASKFTWLACTEQFLKIIDEDRRARGFEC